MRIAAALAALALLAGGAVMVAPFAPPAGAQEEARGEAVGGRLKDPGDEPVEGVTLTVSRGSRKIGQDETSADGTWQVPVPGPATYKVAIDVDTLPEGIALRDPERSTLDRVLVRGGQHKVVLFPLVTGDAEDSGGRRLARLVDLAVDGLRIGAIIALGALGLSLIFGVTGLVNFAHGELVAFGAIAAWYLNSASVDLPLILAAVVAVLLGAAFGGALELGLWRPLRRRRTGSVALLVISIGLALLVRHVFLVLFGTNPRPYAQYNVQRPVSFGIVDMAPKDAVIIGIALVVLVVVGTLFRVTRLGTAMRAVADDRDLAESSGIDVQHVVLATWLGGAALAALGGVFFGTTETVIWDMGGTLLLPMFAAVILGGLGTAYGAMVGGIVLGIASEVSTYWLPVEFKLVFSLSVLIVVLLVRPQGIFGVRERIG